MAIPITCLLISVYVTANLWLTVKYANISSYPVLLCIYVYLHTHVHTLTITYVRSYNEVSIVLLHVHLDDALHICIHYALPYLFNVICTVLFLVSNALCLKIESKHAIQIFPEVKRDQEVRMLT